MPSEYPGLREAAVRFDTQPSLLVVTGSVSALRPERESVVQELGLAGLQIWQSLFRSDRRAAGRLEMASPRTG